MPRLCTMTAFNPTSDRAARIGIVFVILGMLAISINDLLIKTLSDRYSLYQIVFTRSVIGLTITVSILQFEGGFAALKTSSRAPMQRHRRARCCGILWQP